MIYREEMKMGIKDIDKDLKILNKSILEMLENIAVYHADSVNRGPKVTYSENFAWILSDWKIKVLDRPKYGEKLTVETWRRDSKAYHTYRDFRIVDSKGEIKVIGSSKWVMFNFKEMKIVKIENELKKWKQTEEEESVFEEGQIKKIKIPEEYEKVIKYTVKRKDIDVNGHMHNLDYLDLAYEVLPLEIFENRKFDNIQINYKKEIKLNDEIKCKYTEINNKIIVVIKSKDEKITHAIIKMY